MLKLLIKTIGFCWWLFLSPTGGGEIISTSTSQVHPTTNSSTNSSEFFISRNFKRNENATNRNVNYQDIDAYVTKLDGKGQVEWLRSVGTPQLDLIAGSALDSAGNIYTIGSTRGNVSNISVNAGDFDVFVVKYSPKGQQIWIKQIGTPFHDEARQILINKESGVNVIYVSGVTWGTMDEGAHVTNGYNRFGGRDTFFLKLNSNGEKLWSRQFGTNGDDYPYKISPDTNSNTIYVSGGCAFKREEGKRVSTDSMHNFETSREFCRRSILGQKYTFLSVFNQSSGRLEDFVMDGGIWISNNKVIVSEDGDIGIYTIVLNRKPLADVKIVMSTIKVKFAKHAEIAVSPEYVIFTPFDWNKEKKITVQAVDDKVSEGLHYATLTHFAHSSDPNYNSSQVPYLLGKNRTVVIHDNDSPGILFSRRRLFVTEGGVNDSYSVSLRSQPMHNVSIFAVPIHPYQSKVFPPSLKFTPSQWNISQKFYVRAIDDIISENQYGGMHSGGIIKHYLISKDFQYNTRRPRCYFIPVCICKNSTMATQVHGNCSSHRLNSTDNTSCATLNKQVCDISLDCNGKEFCIRDTSVGGNSTHPSKYIPTRFGYDTLNPNPPPLIKTYISDKLHQIEVRSRTNYLYPRPVHTGWGRIYQPHYSLHRFSTSFNTNFLGTAPIGLNSTVVPADIIGYVYSFMGVSNGESLVELFANHENVILSICFGLRNLESHRWAFEEWPPGTADRVLQALFLLIPKLQPKEIWNCGAPQIIDSNGIAVTIFDNDPGITISKLRLQVSESNNSITDQYTIVLNAPPLKNNSWKMYVPICSITQNDSCSMLNPMDFFRKVATNAVQSFSSYDKLTVATIGNAHVQVFPAFLTFNASNWYIPRVVTVAAINDKIYEGTESHSITHRVEYLNQFYNNKKTSFWSSNSMSLFPFLEMNNATNISKYSKIFNPHPTVFHSPQHRRLQVLVKDDDVANIAMPKKQVFVGERSEMKANIGDVVTTNCFAGISLKLNGSLVQSVENIEEYMNLSSASPALLKFHIPQLHGGDLNSVFSSSFLYIKRRSGISMDFPNVMTPERVKISIVLSEWNALEFNHRNFSLFKKLVNMSIEANLTTLHGGYVCLNVTSLVRQVLSFGRPVASFFIEALHNHTSLMFKASREVDDSAVLAFNTKHRNLAIDEKMSIEQSSIYNTSTIAAVAADGNRLGMFSKTKKENDPWLEISLKAVINIGSLIIFKPNSNIIEEIMWLVLSNEPFPSSKLSLDHAKKAGCPKMCSHSFRLRFNQDAVSFKINFPARYIRVYKEGFASLSVIEIEIYSPEIHISRNSNNVGFRSHPIWDASSSWLPTSGWRLQDDVSFLTDKNIAYGMPTTQSSTDPAVGISSIAVNGDKHSKWDATMLGIYTSANNSVNKITTEDGFTSPTSRVSFATFARTKMENSPFWEVDLGSVKPISHIRIFPDISSHLHSCHSNQNGSSFFFNQTNYLQNYTDWDRFACCTNVLKDFFVMISKDPFQANASLNSSIANSDKVYYFGSKNCTTSFHEWSQIYAVGRYIRVQLQNYGVLAIQEFEVFLWNAVSSSKYLLLDLRGTGDSHLGLGGVYVYKGGNRSHPVPFRIHSQSSQLKSSGNGSTEFLSTLSFGSLARGCYISANVSSREWIILEFLEHDSHIESIEFVSNSQCRGKIDMANTVSVSIHSGFIKKDTNSTLFKDYSGCHGSNCLSTIGAWNKNKTVFLHFNDFTDVSQLANIKSRGGLVTKLFPLRPNDYSVIVLRDSPIRYWRLDNFRPSMMLTSVNTVNVNISARNNHEAYFSPGAFFINKLSQLSISHPSKGWFDIDWQFHQTSFSIEFWIKLSMNFFLSNNSCSFATFGDPSVGSSFQIYLERTGIVVFEVKKYEKGFLSFHSFVNASNFVVQKNAWIHIVGYYDRVRLKQGVYIHSKTSHGHKLTNAYETDLAQNSAILPQLSATNKLVFGKSLNGRSGFIGQLAEVAWYSHVLSYFQVYDHFLFSRFSVHEILPVQHSIYSIHLSSQPLSNVIIDINSQTNCYRQNQCNVSASPSSILFTPSNWNVSQSIIVVANNDDLSEKDHSATIIHKSSQDGAYKLTSVVDTFESEHVSNITKREIDIYFKKLVLYQEFETNEDEKKSKRQLMSLSTVWQRQIITEMYNFHNEYNFFWKNKDSSRSIVNATIFDNDVPNVMFSKIIIHVSEDGQHSYFQVVLNTEPRSVVEIHIKEQEECYRYCGKPTKHNPCPILTEFESETSRLCNITVTPKTIYFSSLNWSLPQRVNVMAIDDNIQEDKFHGDNILSYVISNDQDYHKIKLPIVHVNISDNDISNVILSSKRVFLSEDKLLNDSKPINGYNISLTSEPFADVSIEISNEADQTCYRSCGYPIDNMTVCGLPRARTVHQVSLKTVSEREKQIVSLSMPIIYEKQKIVTFADHIDQVFEVMLAGGRCNEIQNITVIFEKDISVPFSKKSLFGKGFKLKFKSAVTNQIDAFISADGMKQQLQLLSTIGNVNVRRMFNKRQIIWSVTFEDKTSGASNLNHAGVQPLFIVVSNLPKSSGAVASVSRFRKGQTLKGDFRLLYGSASTTKLGYDASALQVQQSLIELENVFAVYVVRQGSMNLDGYIKWTITFGAVSTYHTIKVDKSNLIPASQPSTSIKVDIGLLSMNNQISGYFQIGYPTSEHSNMTVNTTNLSWDISASSMASEMELSFSRFLGNIKVIRRRLSPEGAYEWIIEFIGSVGNIQSLKVYNVNLKGKGCAITTDTVIHGDQLGGFFRIGMGGTFKVIDKSTGESFSVFRNMRNSTKIPYNSSIEDMKQAFHAMNITQLPYIKRISKHCGDVLKDQCRIYEWHIYFNNSPGNLPQMFVYHDNLSGKGVQLQAYTQSNGTFIGGMFSATVEVYINGSRRKESTWNLPVTVSAEGFDEALEALSIVKAAREKEYQPLAPDLRLDMGVKVDREGPSLDGGSTWTLHWSFLDSKHFTNASIYINTSLVTQENSDPIKVPTELDFNGKRRCLAHPKTIFLRDKSDPLLIRGYCVYQIKVLITQSLLLCNYTASNPWIIFKPQNWNIPQLVILNAVNDHLDESSISNNNLTYSSITHAASSNDHIYDRLVIDNISIVVRSDDIAKVLISRKNLFVSENGTFFEIYKINLATEPLYSVNISIFPWKSWTENPCYRFGLCNLTLSVNELFFSVKNWYVPQTIVVTATNDFLDEFDVHFSGISHQSFSNDPKYHNIKIPTIAVKIADNDDSHLIVSKSEVNVGEGGSNGFTTRQDTYTVSLSTEPFGKVLVNIDNVAKVGHRATSIPKSLVFTWKNWNIPREIIVQAFDDYTDDANHSKSVLTHSLKSVDFNYNNILPINLPNVSVNIYQDDDISGIQTSVSNITLPEGESRTYMIRLTTKPWKNVVVSMNTSHGCYYRKKAFVVENILNNKICNASILSQALLFTPSTWNKWQTVTVLAVNDHIDESTVHQSIVSHAVKSSDLKYNKVLMNIVKLFILDNDVSRVIISAKGFNLQNFAGSKPSSYIRVAEGGYTFQYSISLSTEPYDIVKVFLDTPIQTIFNRGTLQNSNVKQVNLAGSTLQQSNNLKQNFTLFTPANWNTPQLVKVFAINDNIPENRKHFTTITHVSESKDVHYNISNSTIGLFTLNVEIAESEAIPPPVPKSAAFLGSGMEIIVQFDSIVYHAATMKLSAAGAASKYIIPRHAFSCNEVFNLSIARIGGPLNLGKNSGCKWLDLLSIQIRLGPGSNIAPGDVLVLNECLLEDIDGNCLSPNVLRARHWSSLYSTSSIIISVPTNLPPAKVIISGPERIGSCGTFLLDASSSTGSLGRPVSIIWFALPGIYDGTQVSSLNDYDILKISSDLQKNMSSICSGSWWVNKTNEISKNISLDVVSRFTQKVGSINQIRAMCKIRHQLVDVNSKNLLRFSIQNDAMVPLSTYFYGMKLYTYFKQSAISIHKVSVQNVPSPTIMILDGSLKTVKRTTSLSLEASAIVSCPQVAGTKMGFKWFYDGSNNSNIKSIDFNKTNNARNPRLLKIPAGLLQADTEYDFRIFGYMLQLAHVSNWATVKVVVESSSLIARIKGGDRKVGEGEKILLDGSLSFDPDESVLPFEYIWHCEDITKPSSLPQYCVHVISKKRINFNTPPYSSTSNPILSIPKYHLQLMKKLKFTLTVVKKCNSKSKTICTSVPRNASSQVIITTASGQIPIVEVSQISKKITPSDRVLLEGKITSKYPYTSMWSEDEGDFNMGRSSVTHPYFTLPLKVMNNAIKRNSFSAGKKYIFRLTARDINGNSGFSTLTIKVNAPPIPGKMTVSPVKGQAIDDVFQLDCIQWTDDPEDFPLRYSFAYVPSSGQNNNTNNSYDTDSLIPLVMEQSSSRASTRLPPPTGTFTEPRKIMMVGIITDNLESSSYIYAPIELIPSKEAKANPVGYVSKLMGSGGALQSVSDSGDSAQTVNLILSVALVLKGSSHSSTTTVNKCPTTTTNTTNGTLVTTECSGRGSCDSTFKCICKLDYTGSSCNLVVKDLQSINTNILTMLESTNAKMEPTNTALTQQAMAVGTVVSSDSSGLDEKGRQKASNIISNVALSVGNTKNPNAFLRKSGSTMIDAIGNVMASDSKQKRSSKRRLLSSLNTKCEPQPTSLSIKLSKSLYWLAAVSSATLIPGEKSAVITGKKIKTSSNLGKQLNNEAVLNDEVVSNCITNDRSRNSEKQKTIYINSITWDSSMNGHSSCAINYNGIKRISNIHSVFIHTKYDYINANSNGKPFRATSISSNSSCVKELASNLWQRNRRRLAESPPGNNKRTMLVSVKLEHELVAYNPNITTSCRAWSTKTLEWDAKVCLKDSKRSSLNRTVCNCYELDDLEIMAVLEEKLYFHDIYKKYFRNDPLSMIPFGTVVSICALFLLSLLLGKRKDFQYIKTMEKILQGKLNHENSPGALKKINKVYDVHNFLNEESNEKKQVSLDKLPNDEVVKWAITHLFSRFYGKTKSEVQELQMEAGKNDELFKSISLYDVGSKDNFYAVDQDVLFGTEKLRSQYRRVSFVLKIINVLLILLSIACISLGIDFYFVLGNTGSNFVLLIFGQNVGIVLISFGACLTLLSSFGIFSLNVKNTKVYRRAYLFLMCLMLVAEVISFAVSYQYLTRLKSYPSIFVKSTIGIWNSLPNYTKMEIQQSFGCCGYQTIHDSEILPCPEEAMDAVYPRACFPLLAVLAHNFFYNFLLFGFVTISLQMCATLISHSLIRWEWIRFKEIKYSHENPMSSILILLIRCCIPPLCYMSICLVSFFAFSGIDLLLSLNLTCSYGESVFIGFESGLYLLALGLFSIFIFRWGAKVIGNVNRKHLIKYILSSLILLSLCVIALFFINQASQNMSRFSYFNKVFENRFLKLSSHDKLILEEELHCCGYNSASEGTCDGTGINSRLHLSACKVPVQRKVVALLELIKFRTTLLVFFQIVLLVCLGILFGHSSTPVQPIEENAIQKSKHARKQKDEFGVGLNGQINSVISYIIIFTCIICIFVGTILIGIGCDLIFGTNVVNFSIVAYSISKFLGELSLMFGCILIILSLNGLHACLSRSKKVLIAYFAISFCWFFASFSFLLVFNKLQSDNSKFEGNLRNLWKNIKPSYKKFLQNEYDCCGFEKLLAKNGSWSYSMPYEQPSWKEIDHLKLHNQTIISSRIITSNITYSIKKSNLTITQFPRMEMKYTISCPRAANSGCKETLQPHIKEASSQILWFFATNTAIFSVNCVAAMTLYYRQGKKQMTSWKLAISQGFFICLCIFRVGFSVFFALVTIDAALNLEIFYENFILYFFPFGLEFALSLTSLTLIVIASYGIYGTIYRRLHVEIVCTFFSVIELLSSWCFVIILFGFLNRSSLTSALNYIWSDFSAKNRHALSMELNCCGFNDPIRTNNSMLLWDRPAVGFGCPNNVTKGCVGVLVGKIGNMLNGIYEFVLAFAIYQLINLIANVQLLVVLKKLQPNYWKHIRLKVICQLQTFQNNIKNNHMMLSLKYTYDEKFTRAQRLTSIFCGFLMSLWYISQYLSANGCYRWALISCEQPTFYIVYLGLIMSILSFGSQFVFTLLFRKVMNRRKYENKAEVSDRERKEKVYKLRKEGIKSSQSSTSSFKSSLASIRTSHERFHDLLMYIAEKLIYFCCLVRSISTVSVASFSFLVVFEVIDEYYRVKIVGATFLLYLCGLAGISIVLSSLTLVFYSRNDASEGKNVITKSFDWLKGKIVVLNYINAVLSIAIVAGIVLMLFMFNQSLEKPNGQLNWTQRNTDIIMVNRINSAWKSDPTGFYRNRVQQELKCCGLSNGTELAFRPCPLGTYETVQMKAKKLDGSIIGKNDVRYHDLEGCLPKLMSLFESLSEKLNNIGFFLIVIEFIFCICTLFHAYDFQIHRNSKLKLKLGESKSTKNSMKKQYPKGAKEYTSFSSEKLGLKLDSPQRGRIGDQLRQNSLDMLDSRITNILASSDTFVYKDTDAKRISYLKKFRSLASDSILPWWIIYVVYSVSLLWVAGFLYLIVSKLIFNFGTETSLVWLLCFGISILIHVVLVEPIVLFLFHVRSLFFTWFQQSLMAYCLYTMMDYLGLRTTGLIKWKHQQILDSIFDADDGSEDLSSDPFDRIRKIAALKIQHRWLVKLAHMRFNILLRVARAEAYRLLVIKRNKLLASARSGFVDEEVHAFKMLFDSLDHVDNGQVRYNDVAKSVYRLGIEVDEMVVYNFLYDLNPSFADSVDFDHFLYAMACIRTYHQREVEKSMVDEEFISVASLLGPSADPKVKAQVKRQNLLREKRNQRQSTATSVFGKQTRAGNTTTIAGKLQLSSKKTEPEKKSTPKPSGAYMLLTTKKMDILPKRKSKKPAGQTVEAENATDSEQPKKNIVNQQATKAAKDIQKAMKSLNLKSKKKGMKTTSKKK